MFLATRPTWTVLAFTILMLVSDRAAAQDSTQTLKTHLSSRRNTLAKRDREFQCGQVKSNDAFYPNNCICFDAAGKTVVSGESEEVVKYANEHGFKFPSDPVVAPNQTSNNGNGLCSFPEGGPFTNNKFDSNHKCCDFTCTYGLCGEGDTAVCLTVNQACQSGHAVPKPARKRDMYGASCPQGLTSCVVAETAKRQLYECVDTQKDLESCGGCLYSDLRYGGSTASGTYGQDCSAIPNVAEVACESGHCKIYSCDAGYELANGECVRLTAALIQQNQYRL